MEDIFNQLYRESLFKSYTLVNRLLSLIETGELSGVRTDTLKRLLNPAAYLCQHPLPRRARHRHASNGCAGNA